MGEKDGFITPERLEMLVSELLKHKNFDALSLLVFLKIVKRSLPRGWRFCAACLTR